MAAIRAAVYPSRCCNNRADRYRTTIQRRQACCTVDDVSLPRLVILAEQGHGCARCTAALATPCTGGNKHVRLLLHTAPALARLPSCLVPWHLLLLLSTPPARRVLDDVVDRLFGWPDCHHVGSLALRRRRRSSLGVWASLRRWSCCKRRRSVFVGTFDEGQTMSANHASITARARAADNKYRAMRPPTQQCGLARPSIKPQLQRMLALPDRHLATHRRTDGPRPQRRTRES